MYADLQKRMIKLVETVYESTYDATPPPHSNTAHLNATPWNEHSNDAKLTF